MLKLVLLLFFEVATTVQERAADYDYDELTFTEKQLEGTERRQWKVQVEGFRAELWEAKSKRDRRTSNMGMRSRSELPRRWNYLEYLSEYIKEIKNLLWDAKKNLWYGRARKRETKPDSLAREDAEEMSPSYDDSRV